MVYDGRMKTDVTFCAVMAAFPELTSRDVERLVDMVRALDADVSDLRRHYEERIEKLEKALEESVPKSNLPREPLRESDDLTGSVERELFKQSFPDLKPTIRVEYRPGVDKFVREVQPAGHEPTKASCCGHCSSEPGAYVCSECLLHRNTF